MEIHFLGADYRPVAGPADKITSFIWSRRFHECGSFSIHTVAEEAEKYAGASFVFNPGAGEYGRIERISYGADGSAVIRGRLLESLLCDRIVTESLPMSGNLETVVRTVAVNNSISDRQIAYLTYGAPSGLTETVAAEKETVNLSDWLYGILKPFGMSYSLRFEPSENRVVFRIVRGTDRGPDSASPVFFSANGGNLISLETDYSEAEMKNFAYVEGKDGYVTTAVLEGVSRDEPATHREMYVSAHNVDPADFTYYADYIGELRNAGNKALRDYRETLCVRCEVTPDLPGYRTGFDLGDVVAVDPGHGYGVRGVRVTEADEIWEDGTFRVEIVLGDRLMDVKRFVQRELIGNRAVR